jgi:hypothetical protein
MIRWILPLALFAVAGFAPAEDKKPDAPKPDPETTPLELRITGKTTKFTLDTGGLSSADYKKQVEAAAAAKGGRPAPTPVIDLAVEIKNTSDKPVKVWTTGDPVVLTLTLKGKGAVNANWSGPMTLEFRLPNAVEIEAGKTHMIPLKSLASGSRGRSHYSYWTEPGDHELVATLKTGVSPAPKGAKEAMDGFGQVTLTSPAFPVTVEEKK